MISFRTRSDAMSSIAILIALVVLVGTGFVLAFVPKPSTDGTATGKIRSQRELDERLDALTKNRTASRAAIAKLVWQLPTEQIGPKALASITAFAQRNRLKLVAFRPQKAVEVNELQQLPFVISIEGPYPSLMRFVKDLESPELKLGTSLVQISTSDPNSDIVSATIGVVAYRPVSAPKTSEKPNAAKKEN